MAPTALGESEAALTRQLRDALAQLYDEHALQRHPLAAAMPGDSRQHRGRELRQRLTAAIDGLRPESPSSPNARLHRLVTLRYVEAWDAPAVQRELGIAKSQYYREHGRALELLADHCHEWLTPASAPPAFDYVPLTSFVGRDQECRELERLLADAAVRLVTLTGPGGVGKTRLSRETAAHLRVEGQTVLFVQLADVGEPDGVLPAIARAAGIEDGPSHQLAARLALALGGRPRLLVLDNFEHLLTAGPAVAELLAACPRLQVLATSREPLGLYGERELRLEPLGLGPEAPAVQLFLDRAEVARRGASLPRDTLDLVAGVCGRLDGLPLAIELAAAQLRLLSLAELGARLDQGLATLAHGPRDFPERQRTLRAAIEWSCNLLAPAERTLFTRLAVFRGGWTLAAAQAVCIGGEVSADELLDVLLQLANKSLVVVEVSDTAESRYSMLETLRLYASELLAQGGELAGCRQRHAAYYTGLAEAADPRLFGPDQLAACRQLTLEQANFRAALDWAAAPNATAAGADLALRMAAALGWYWHLHGDWQLGREALSAALQAGTSGGSTRAAAAARAEDLVRREPGPSADEAVRLASTAGAQGRTASQPAPSEEAPLAPDAPDGGEDLRHEPRASTPEIRVSKAAATGGAHDGELRAKAWARLAFLAWGQNDYAAAVEAAQHAAGAAEAETRASGLTVLGLCAMGRAHKEAGQLLSEAVQVCNAAGYAWGLGVSQVLLAHAHLRQNQLDLAEPLVQAGQRVLRPLGERWAGALAASHAGWVAAAAGELERAAALFEDSLTLYEELGNKGQNADTMLRLGQLELRRGQTDRARRLFTDSLAIRRDLGSHLGIAHCLRALAAPELTAQRPIEAARYLAASEQLRGQTGFPLSQAEQVEHDSALAAARERLTADAFAQAWAAGEESAIEDILTGILPL